MKLKHIIESPCGIGYMLEQLDLKSGYARRHLLNTEMMTTGVDISASYGVLRQYVDFIGRVEPVHLNTLLHKLMCLNDLHTTVDNLSHGATLDDIELFELKQLGILSGDVRRLLEDNNIEKAIVIPNLDDVVTILDPDGMRIATFYVYDSYSEQLRDLRALMRKQPERRDELLIEAAKIEDEIRAQLSMQLRRYAQDIYIAQVALAEIDITIAKARQLLQLGLCFPGIATGGITVYNKMFNPQVKAVLAACGAAFQPVDISVGQKPTLITGANMGGKTVVLKTLTLCQYLFQYGFGIPAGEAQIAVKDEIYLCMGDEQSVERGLSSFAAEMKNIDAVVKASREKGALLALIDEPARTTNPVEGTALVSALLSVLDGTGVNLVMTTHYDVDPGNARCLRVKGFENGEMNYALVEVRNGEVPHEALTIARSLGIDDIWLDKAGELLKISKNYRKNI